MSGPQHKPESRCLPVSCGPGMPGPYASTMFYHAITAHVPGTVKTVPYKAPVDPDLEGGVLTPPQPPFAIVTR